MSDADSVLTVMVEGLVSTHSHLREGVLVKPLIELLALGGVDTILPMPNTDAGLTTVDQVLYYQDQAVLAAKETHCRMAFIPTVMVTENTSTEMIRSCRFHRLLAVLKEGGFAGNEISFSPGAS